MIVRAARVHLAAPPSNPLDSLVVLAEDRQAITPILACLS